MSDNVTVTVETPAGAVVAPPQSTNPETPPKAASVSSEVQNTPAQMVVETNPPREYNPEEQTKPKASATTSETPTEGRRRGRPPKVGTKGDRLTVLVDPEIKRRLDDVQWWESRHSHRTMTDLVEEALLDLFVKYNADINDKDYIARVTGQLKRAEPVGSA